MLLNFTLVFVFSFRAYHLILRKSHNIPCENLRDMTKFLYFVQMAGASKICGSVFVAVFARVTMTCHGSPFRHPNTINYEIHLSLVGH